jgi:hypothetical protein
MQFHGALFLAAATLACLPAAAIERPGVTYKIYQFPANMIPRIDGNTDDWAMLPKEYVVDIGQTMDTVHGRGRNIDRKDLDAQVRVGWVKGMNRLYFLYEAYDNYWDFAGEGLHNDTFEVVVDGDLSGGPLIARFHPHRDLLGEWEAYFSFQSVHAQNYHIFTPAEGKDWAMFWGCQSWLKELPYSNHAYSYDFKPGQPGKLVLEFWITPFDFASCDGPRSSVESKLEENKLIGLSWAFLDYDDINAKTHVGFWNLSHKQTMYGQASELVAFKLMPLEEKYKKAIDAQWTFKVVDMSRRLVAFEDRSAGQITSWKWDFGDGTTATDQYPLHTYKNPGNYVVTLWVDGPAGKSKLEKVWDVVVK